MQILICTTTYEGRSINTCNHCFSPLMRDVCQLELGKFEIWVFIFPRMHEWTISFVGLRNGTCVKSILSGHCMKNSWSGRRIFASNLMHSYFFQNISRTDAWNKLPFETVIDQYYVLNITYFQMQIMEKKHLLCNI